MDEKALATRNSVGFSLDKQIDLKGNFSDTKVESLPEGEYCGAVKKAQVKKIDTKNGPATLFEILVEIESKQYVITYWLTSDGNVKRCLSGLKRLGFDADQWGPDFSRPYPDELRKAGEQMINKLLTFTRKTTNNGFPTIGLEELSDHAVMAPGTNAGAFIDHEELPF